MKIVKLRPRKGTVSKYNQITVLSTNGIADVHCRSIVRKYNVKLHI